MDCASAKSGYSTRAIMAYRMNVTVMSSCDNTMLIMRVVFVVF